MGFKIKDPVSGGTHLIGAVLAVVASIFLNLVAAREGTILHVVAFSIFGASLILLYTASSLYHLLPLSQRASLLFKRLDHMMIFVLIAGSSTPLCLITLKGVLGWTLFGVFWGLALLGCLLKLFWIHAPRGFSTACYMGIGWIMVFFSYPLIQKMSWVGFGWVAAGGLFYTIGALIYGFKWPNPVPKWFGFHEIFHLFVMAGSSCSVWAVAKYVR